MLNPTTIELFNSWSCVDWETLHLEDGFDMEVYPVETPLGRCWDAVLEDAQGILRISTFNETMVLYPRMSVPEVTLLFPLPPGMERALERIYEGTGGEEQ